MRKTSVASKKETLKPSKEIQNPDSTELDPRLAAKGRADRNLGIAFGAGKISGPRPVDFDDGSRWVDKSIESVAQDIQLMHDRFFYRPSGWLVGTLMFTTASLGVDLLGGWEFFRYPYLTILAPGFMTIDALYSASRMPDVRKKFGFTGLGTFIHRRYGEIRFFDHDVEKLPASMKSLYRGGSARACTSTYVAASLPYVGAAWGIWGAAEGISWWKNGTQ